VQIALQRDPSGQVRARRGEIHLPIGFEAIRPALGNAGEIRHGLAADMQDAGHTQLA
jgi:hypothetical protein